ncbi:sensor histidine kinase [Paenibacillus gallinarum]|uniref:histidine kinase n=1 Tax=Paenibacillus gallinarum TaxID=2762232 RepID=A0ABR8T2G1_9BACL|nr:sensor histidine kinase [Paenibacillus gallinarum]MBD7969955.1 sensor histidine kinase [Paenibacillus gallinarum]
MIWTFLKERRTWLLLLLSIQLIILFISYIDSTIPFMSMLYIVLLLTLLCITFVVLRYMKETRFYSNMKNWDHTYDLAELSSADSPFEQIVLDAVTLQTERYKRETSYNYILLEQEKDELLSWIHEVKTPLTAMQLMIDRLPDETLQRQLMYEWLRIHHLLDQQLHQKRIPFIQNDLYIEVSELEPIIHQEIRVLKSWCIQKGIGFDVSLTETKVLTDAKWLGFILRQLITNAVKYSASSDVLIESSRLDDHVVLTIQDTGRGIDPKDLPRIYERGFTSTTHHEDGASTGMGLYLAKQVADSLHIRMNVSSVLGEGTTFTLTFPRKNEFVRITGM